MITIRPVSRALVPIDSEAARRLSAPNYDEFQSDEEIKQEISERPDSVLRVTMAHADVPENAPPLVEGSPEALAHAGRIMDEVRDSALTREVTDVLWVYEIRDSMRPAVRQIGVGGMGLIEEIRTPERPGGTIIRNEGIREAKARGRAELIRATGAIVGTVTNAVDDREGRLFHELRKIADGRAPDLEVTDGRGNTHRIWLVGDRQTISALQACLAAEPHAYVADGNHRSAAAAMLGREEFLTVFFPAETMGIRPYNRLVSSEVAFPADLSRSLVGAFSVTPRQDPAPFQPDETHRIGVYRAGRWYELVPLPTAFDPNDAAQDIDADIVQRHLFDAVLGISDPRDPRLRFVGSNRDAAYLVSEVDRGDYGMAVTLPPVTMEQFTRICLQNRMMPPKSTWFEPKIRSGLVMALL